MQLYKLLEYIGYFFRHRNCYIFKAATADTEIAGNYCYGQYIVIIVIELPNQNKAGPKGEKKYVSSLQYGYRKCGTHARVPAPTLALWEQLN